MEDIINDFKFSEYEEELIAECKAKRIPALGVIELTPLCNFNCKMCYVHLSKEQLEKSGKALLPKEKILETVSQAVEMGLYDIALTGGEALTRADFREIYEAIYNMGVGITIRSNGFAVTDGLIEWLSERQPKLIQITIYGGSNEMYEKICGVKHGYDTVTANVEKLVKAGFNVSLSYTGTNENQHEHKTASEWAKGLNLSLTAYFGLFKPNDNTGRDVTDQRIDFKPLPMKVPEDAFVEPPEKHFEKNKPFSICRNFGAQFYISWDGFLSVCLSMKSVAVDLTDMSFADAYKKLYENCDKIKHPKKCLDCKYAEFCDACPSRLESETGSPEKTSDYYCKKAKWQYEMYWCQLEEKKNEGKK